MFKLVSFRSYKVYSKLSLSRRKYTHSVNMDSTRDLISTIQALNSLQSNASVIAQWKQQLRTNKTMDPNVEMRRDCEIVGIDLDWLSNRAIHVAGTKGKGSTCSFSESILRQYGLRTGLYTSPHLVSVLERIRLDGKSVHDDIFIRNFWDCWDKLKATRTEQWPLMPGWFRFMTILAFKIFYETKVDVAVIEVGVGGRTDFTNVLKQTVTCGITLLDYDHVDVLGNTLSEIASHKAGIFKPGVPGIISPQKREALITIKQIASNVQNPLYISRPLQQYLDLSNLKPVDLNINAQYQQQNAALAIALVDSFLQQKNSSYSPLVIPDRHNQDQNEDIPMYRLFELPDAFKEGIKNHHFSGRAQTIYLKDAPIKVFLDGAHTIESIKSGLQWFKSQYTDGLRTSKSFIFNCNKPRNPKLLLAPLLDLILSHNLNIHNIYITQSHVEIRNHSNPSNDITYANKDLSWQVEISEAWLSMVAESKELGHTDVDWPTVEVLPTVNAAVDRVKSQIQSGSYDEAEMLVIGSLYLVGAFLEYAHFPTRE